MLLPVRGYTPKIDSDCYVAPNASVVGEVHLGPRCTVMFNAVIRGDVMPIDIGEESNIQDAVVIHGTYQKWGTKIGRRVSVGHGAVLHGCTVGDGCLIGMGALLMDNCSIGEHCLVAAGSLVTEGSKFPPGHLIMGRPAKVKRPLKKEEINQLEKSADNYLIYKTWYQPSGD